MTKRVNYHKSEQIKDKVLELYKKNYTIKEIAFRSGCSTSTVMKIIKDKSVMVKEIKQETSKIKVNDLLDFVKDEYLKLNEGDTAKAIVLVQYLKTYGEITVALLKKR